MDTFVFKLQKFTLPIHHEINSTNNVHKNYNYSEPGEKKHSLQEILCFLTLNQAKYTVLSPLSIMGGRKYFVKQSVNKYFKLTIT
jgi:hypothetical protein